MSLLTAFEKQILKLRSHDLSDYAIARELNTDPPTVNRSRKNAHKKLKAAKEDIAWVEQLKQSVNQEGKPTKKSTLRTKF